MSASNKVCHPLVYEHGKLYTYTDAPAEQADKMCKELTDKSNDFYDWYYFGDRIVIKRISKDLMSHRDIKDHEIAIIVNKITKIAKEYGNHGCLRELISIELCDILKNSKIRNDKIIK